MIEIVFWGSALFILYAYLGYPSLLLALSAFRTRPLRKAPITPAVSFIIAAHNEEKRIGPKIENTLKQNYPRESLEIIVASDCSDDRTDLVVGSYQTSGVRLVRAGARKGKEAAQKLALDTAAGDIIIFSDVAATLPTDGVAKILEHFADPTVGCVSSVDRFVDADGNVGGEGAYVRYEMFVRRLETTVNTLVGLSGSLFAARRQVCRDWQLDRPSDFNTLLNAVKMGLRGVSDPECFCYYTNILDEKREFQRKSRTVLRGIVALMRSRALLNPLRYGLFSWQLLSHKLCRWLVPVAMILAFLANGLLVWQSTFYLSAFVLQSTFYFVALAGLWADIRSPLIKFPCFLLLVNLSALHAWCRYVRGEQIVFWTPSERMTTNDIPTH